MYAMRALCILTVAALGLAGCVAEPEPAVTLDGVAVRVLLADTAEERSRGLQGHDALADGEGMLFVFDDVAVRTFAMKDVAFPIDVVFIADDMTVSGIEPLDPGDARLVSSPGPSPYVIELSQGWAAEQGIAVGSTLEVADLPQGGN